MEAYREVGLRSGQSVRSDSPGIPSASDWRPLSGCPRRGFNDRDGGAKRTSCQLRKATCPFRQIH